MSAPIEEPVEDAAEQARPVLDPEPAGPTDSDGNPLPLEATDADVAEQRAEVPDDPDERR